MSKRNLIIFLLLIGAAVAVFLLLKPCGSKPDEALRSQATEPAPKQPEPAAKAPEPMKKITAPGTPEAAAKPAIVPADKTPAVEKNVPPAPHEVDTAPPVNLTGSEVIPDIGKCATRNFPSEAKPYVPMATVTVRLVVDKFGNVRSDTPIAVEFPPDVDEEQVPAMRKLFIKAGARAFGAKKCPPHVVNGQNFGYAIEVPLQYKR